MDETEYNNLIRNYEQRSIKICIEKCCNYRFIFFLNENARLKDLYNYVIQFYVHVTEPILLYKDSSCTKMIPNNDIYLSKYFEKEQIVSSTGLELPVVYKFHMNICSNNKQIYNQNYNQLQ